MAFIAVHVGAGNLNRDARYSHLYHTVFAYTHILKATMPVPTSQSIEQRVTGMTFSLTSQ